jgi:hypothetical protein
VNLQVAFKSVMNLKLKLNNLTLNLNPVLLLRSRRPNLPTRLFVHVALKLIVILYFPLNPESYQEKLPGAA